MKGRETVVLTSILINTVVKKQSQVDVNTTFRLLVTSHTLFYIAFKFIVWEKIVLTSNQKIKRRLFHIPV